MYAVFLAHAQIEFLFWKKKKKISSAKFDIIHASSHEV